MNRFFFIFIIIFIAACSSNGLPNNIIKINDMKTIMWDLTKAEQYREIKNITDSISSKTSITTTFQQVLSLHKIKKEDFYRSLNYFQSNPNLNKILFDSIAAFSARERELFFKEKSNPIAFKKSLRFYQNYPALNKTLFDSNSVKFHKESLTKY